MKEGRRSPRRDGDAFKFRVLTLRQVKDGRFFFHDGSFTKVRDVVQYFNAGVPLDPVAGAAPTLSTRFTHPRGTGSPRGLGLSKDQVDDLTDFLENGLYDPSFAKFDPKSPKTFFQLSPIDVTYSKYRPDLAALGAVDGRPPSGMPQDNDDPLSRRDMGLEFLDVTAQAHVSRIDSDRRGRGQQTDTYRITNNSTSVIDTHLLVVAKGLSGRARLNNASGITSTGDPYLRVFLPDGVLQPGQSIVQRLVLTRSHRHEQDRRRDESAPMNYRLELLSGQGKP